MCKVESAFLLFNPPTSIDKATSVNCGAHAHAEKVVKGKRQSAEKSRKLGNNVARLFANRFHIGRVAAVKENEIRKSYGS